MGKIIWKRIGSLMKEKKLWKAIICLVTVSWSLWAGGAREDINSRTDYGRFSAVSIRVPADVIIEKDTSCRVEADVSSRYSRDIEIFNDKGTLIIRPVRRGLNVFKTEDIRFIIYLPMLEEIHTNSSGRVRSKQTWESEEIRIRATASASIELGTLIADDIKLRTTASGDISVHEIKGKAVEIRSTASGDMLIDKISSTNTVFSMTASGTLRTHLNTQMMESRQTGSGDIILSGRAATASIKTTGSGDFKGNRFQTDESDITITGSGDVSLMEGSRFREIKITGSGSFSNYE
jgi:hypothetical protein